MAFYYTSMAWRSRTLVGSVRECWAPNPPSRFKHPAWCNKDVPGVAEKSGAERRVDESSEAKLARLLAVLFLAKEPIASRKLSQYSNLADGTEARTLVNRLNRQLDSQGRAFRVEYVAGGYQMVTRPKFAKWLRRLEYMPGEVRLSAPAMETLSVVAYQQPVLRADVEAIRGVSCGEILNQLLTRDLIRIGGRSDELGRPYLYNTTKRFLQLFGLRNLDELPRPKSFELAQPASPIQNHDEQETTASSDRTKGISEEN